MAVDAARAKALFLAASDLADPERAAYLDRECGGDAELRARVEALLRANDAAPLPQPATAETEDRLPPTEEQGDPTARVGAILAGKYKLIEEIGAGGMGSVFMAQQTSPVKRAVAVKVIKAGMDSKAVLARFEAERQALAMMDHPNIARVLDAGTTEAGRPFFVMELVKGVPITQYCDDHKLTPRQRLELFIPVCLAIQHAHQKGVIHRDIKPSNVLVAMYDDRPVPKVIDFGVAKATGPTLTDRTLMTGFGAVVGTPEYMSPEQASLNNLDIDTRSDVYSLGVLLYELLTGSTPVDRKSLGQAALLEILRIVREVEAPRPSAKLSSSATLPSVAANRGTEPAKLSRLMKGELDWVVLRALEKDRTRRYDTANALARDVQRYLADELVEARPPSTGYRLMKFLRRHKGQVLAATLVLLSLLAGIVVSAYFAVQASESARQATQREGQVTEIAGHLKAEGDRARDAKVAAELNAEAARRAEKLAYRRYYASQMNLAQQAWDAGRPTDTVDMLESLRPRFDEDDLRDFEWYHLWGRCYGQRRFHMTGHRGWVTALAYAPDGRTVASSSADSTVKLWDTATGRERATLRNAASGTMALVFSPDSRTLAAAGQYGRVTLWDAATGKEARLFPTGQAGSLTRFVAFSPAGDVLAAGLEGGHVVWWDVATGQRRASIREHTGPVIAGAFSPDGKTLVTGAGWGVTTKQGQTVVWDVTGPPRVVRKHAQATGIAFSPDGKTLALNSFGALVLMDFATGQEQKPEGITKGGWGVAFSPDGGTLAMSSGRTLVLLDRASGQRRVLPHSAEVVGVAFSSDGRTVAAGGRDSVVTLWEVATSEQPVFENPLTGSVRLAYSPDGKMLAAAGKDGVVKLWDARTGEARGVLREKGVEAKRLAFSSDGTTIALEEYGGNVEVWAVGDRKLRRSLPVKYFSNSAGSLAFSPDGRLFTLAASTRHVQVLDAWTLEPVTQLEPRPDWGDGSGPSAATFSPDGRWLVVGHYAHCQATFWDTATWQRGKVLRLRGVEGWVYALSFSPDGRVLATGCGDGVLKLWDIPSGKLRATLKGHTGDVSVVAFLPGGQVLASLSEDGVRLWDVETGQERVHLRGKALAVAPDGRSMVVGLGPGGVLRADRPADAVAPRSELDSDDPDSPVSLIDLGDKAQTPAEKEAAYLKAQARLDKLAAAFPKEPGYRREQVRVLAGLANVWLAAGRLDEAEAAYRRIIVMTDAGDVARLNNWAWGLAINPDVRLRHPAAAVALASKAVEMSPVNGMYWNTLGVAHYRAGGWADAVAALEKSMSLRAGGDAFDLYFLAMSQAKLGDTAKARDCFDRAVKWHEAQKGLTPQNAAELQRFRAEAAELLGLK